MVEIRLDGVVVDLAGSRVLHPLTLNLTVRRLAVIGANGSGKSTFVRLLNGLVAPSAGTVTVAGVDVARDPKAVRERVGFVFSNPDAQLLMPTVAEDLALSLRERRLPRAERDALVLRALDRFGLTGRGADAAQSLSGGQKQLLALAGVLIRDPDLVIADEPTTLLDLINARRMARLLVEEMAPAAVIVTHDLDLAARCDEAIVFDEGRLVDRGDPAEVIGRYRVDQEARA